MVYHKYNSNDLLSSQCIFSSYFLYDHDILYFHLISCIFSSYLNHDNSKGHNQGHNHDHENMNKTYCCILLWEWSITNWVDVMIFQQNFIVTERFFLSMTHNYYVRVWEVFFVLFSHKIQNMILHLFFNFYKRKKNSNDK